SQAESAMSSIAEQLSTRNSNTNKDWDVLVVPVTTQFTSFVGPIVLALFIGVGILLLIGAVNIASLCAARFESREKEILMRLALGGSRQRLVQFFCIELLLTTLPSAALGIGFAWVLLPRMVSLLPVQLPIPLPGVQ